MKNKNIWQSIKCALSGMKLAFEYEKNFKLYIIIASIFLVFNIVLKSSLLEFGVYVILCSLVFAFEYVNTAIERIVDKFITTKNDDAKYIKDVASSSVLTCGIAFFVVEGLIFISKIIR